MTIKGNYKYLGRSLDYRSYAFVAGCPYSNCNVDYIFLGLQSDTIECTGCAKPLHVERNLDTHSDQEMGEDQLLEWIEKCEREDEQRARITSIHHAIDMGSSCSPCGTW